MHISKWLFAPKLIYAENSSEWNFKKKRVSRPLGHGTVWYLFHTNVFEAYFVFKARPFNSMLIYPRQSDFKDTSTITTGYCWNEGLTSRQCFIDNKTCKDFSFWIKAQTSTRWIEQDPFRGKRLEMNEKESKFWEDLVKK